MRGAAAACLLFSASIASAQTITPIHDIQGPGASSPIVGSTVIIRGIVTGVAANGFFVQEEDAEVDADPATSEGIFVLTSGAPPAAAAFSAQVQVTGTVTEFVPPSDLLQPPRTELTAPTVTQLAPPGQPLPTATTLTSTFPDPAGPFDQLERVEGMRVSVASLTVTGPSAGTIDEVNATATNSGRFHGTITGVPRPFLEAGIQAPDPPPSGSIPPIPRWDSNPELLRIDSAAVNAQPALSVKTNDVVGPLVGPLDYGSRTYTIVPDGTVGTPVVTPGPPGATIVTPPAGHEITVASFNLQRFFDTVDNPAIGEPVLTAAAYDRRLAKAALAIRQNLLHPDIIGVQEVETLSALQDIATRVNAAAGPQYAAFLIEGNDVAGIDVGFLVKTTEEPGGSPRVSVNAVTQQLAGALAVNPDSSTELLWERPPLVLEATVNRLGAASFPVVVIVAQHRGAEDIDSLQPGGNGWPTLGDRVRARRLEQAESLANYVQSRQTVTPDEHLVLVGDFAASAFNDGYVDVLNVVAGTPPPDNQTAVPGDGVDLVNPDLVTLLAALPAAERYSHVPDGHARAVDHVLVGAGLVADTSARRIEYARIGADHPETERNDPTTAYRVSDHDPVVAYLATDSLLLSDLSIAITDAPDPVTIGTSLTYTISAINNGPDAANSVSLSNPLPAGTTFVSLSAGAGWSCTTPPVGGSGTVACVTSQMAVGSASFVLTVAVQTSVPDGTVLSNTATLTAAAPDPQPGNNSSTASTVAVNGPPTITDIADQAIAEDSSTIPLPFTIGDLVTPAANLALSAGSSDTSLVPLSNIVFGGSGPDRTVTVTPAANQHGGPVTITVTVGDGQATANDTFQLTVSPVNDAPTITDIPDVTIAENTPTGALPFTIDDVETPAQSLTLSVTTSDPTIVPPANVVFSGSGANRAVTVTPAPDQHGGPVTMTVTVSDGTDTASDTFLLTVAAGNSPPTLSGLVDATIDETKTITQTLTVADDSTAPEALTVAATSSNHTLLPDGGVVVTGTGPTRTLTLTPIEEMTGETLITVTTSDGELTTTETARLVVTAAPPPDAPTGLVATAFGNEITFTWNAPAAGATPTFYVLEGGTAPGSTSLPVINTRSRGTAWSLTLPTGAYYVRVRAANRAGISVRSNEAAVIVSGPAALAGPPSAFSASVVDPVVTLQWLAGTVGSLPTAWRIELGATPGARDLGIVHVGPGTTTAQGALPSGDYFVRVRGVNAAGQGPASQEVRVHVGARPSCEVPEAPVLLPAAVIDRRVQLAWRESRNTAVASYRLLVGSQPGAADILTFDVGPVTVFGAPAPPREYFVSVVATNDCGASAPSNVIRVVVAAGPPAPANLRGGVNGPRVSVGWDAVPRVDGYVLEVGTAPGQTDIASIPTTATGFAADDVASGTYHVRVRAVRAGLRSEPSGEVVLVVP